MAQTLNYHLVVLNDMCNDFLFDLTRSVSSGVPEFRNADQVRLLSYIDALEGYLSYVHGFPQLDTPKSHPRTYELRPTPDFEKTENHMVNLAANLMQTFQSELTAAPSGRLNYGIDDFEKARGDALLSNMRTFMNSYVQGFTPLDRPESTPEEPGTGPGRGGI